MSDTFGADPHLNVVIDADADAAASEVQDSMADAIANAMKDPRIRAAILNLVNAVTKGAQGIPKGFDRAFKEAERDARRAARNMKGIFDEVGKSASRALKNPPPNASASYQTLSAHIATMANNMDKLLEASKEQVRVIEELGRSTRNQVNAEAQAARDATNRTTQELRSQSARSQLYAQIIKQVGQVTTAALRGLTRVVSTTQRTILRVVELTWKSAERAVRAFARGAAEAIRGLGRGVAAAFRGMGHIVSAFVRTASSTLRGLGRGLTSVLSGMSRAFLSAFRRDEAAFKTSLSRRERALSSSLGRQQQAVQRAQNVRQGGLLGGLGVGGLAAGGGILGLLTSGFERASQEESLQLALETILGDADAAAAKLQQLSDYARTTAFDFVGLGQAVLGFTAVTGDIDKAEGLTTFLADMIALTGGNTAQFERAALAFQQIISAGRIEGDELRQLSESLPGIPIADILIEKFFGGDREAFAKARRAGELGATITAEGFFAALQEGIDERFPEAEGAAVRLAGTLGGLAANLRENFAIFGAEVIRLVEGPIKSLIGGLSDALLAVGSFVSGEMFTQDEVVIGGGAGLLIREPELENLERLRDLLGAMAKTVGGVLSFAASMKVLRLALIGLTSPLGLLIIGSAAIGGFFKLLYDASPRLRSTIGVLGDQIMPTVRAFQQFFRLLGGAVARTLFGPGNNIFTRMGDALRYVVVILARAVVAIRHFVNTLSLLIAAGRADLIDDVVIERLVNFSKSVGEFLGNLFGIDQADIDAEGGGIAGFLRNTFLEPIVNFFTDTLPNAISGFPGFIGNIWNAIFGQGESDGPGAAFRAEEGAEGSIATRVLNVLEDTFLGPIIRFFRGPFADGVESAIGFLVDVFQGLVDGIEAVWRFLEPILDPLTDAFRDFFTTFREEGAGAAFGSLGRGLLDTLGNIGSALLEFGSNIPGYLEDAANVAIPFIAEKLGPIWDAITTWFKDTFTVENLLAAGFTFLNFVEDVGFILGNILGDIRVWGALFAATGAVIAVLAKFFIGVLKGLISNGPEWGSIIVGGINDALGGILPDSITDGGVISAAIGAAIIAAVVAGVAIAGKGAFALGGGGTTRGFSFGGLAAGIAGSLLSSIGREFKALWRGGAAIFTNNRAAVTGDNAVFRGIGQKIGGALIGGMAIAFGGYQIGQNISGPGGILLGALLGAGTGAALGTAIAPGIGTALGAAVGGALGLISTAFGQNAKAAEEATGRVNEYVQALSGITGAGARGAIAGVIAQNLTEDVDALEDWGNALIDSGFNVDTFAQQIIDGTAEADTAFADFVAGLRDQLIETGEISAEEADAIIAAYREVAESGVFTDVNELAQAVQENLGVDNLKNFRAATEAIDFTGILSGGGDAGNVFEFLSNSIKDSGRAFEVFGAQADVASEVIDSVSEAVAAVNEELEGDTTAQAIADILSQSDLSSEQRLEALGDVADDIRDRFAEARDQLEQLLNPDRPETSIGGITNQIVADLPTIAAGFENIFADFEAGEITPNVSFAQVELEVEDFRGQISDAVLQGFDNGAIDTEAEFDTFLSGLRTNIENAGLSTAVEDQLLAVVSEFEGMDLSEFFDLVGLIQQDEATVNEAADILAEQVAAILAGSGATGGRPMVEARELGGKIVGEIGAGLLAQKGAFDEALAKVTGGGDLSSQLSGKKDKPGVEVDDSSVADAQSVVRRTLAVLVAGTALMLRAGANLGEALARGFRSSLSGISSLAGAAAAQGALAAQRIIGLMFQVGANLANALARGLMSQLRQAVNVATLVAVSVAHAARRALGISSPSKVFMNIGRDIGRGFIQGIKDSEGDMVQALSDALESVVTKATEKAGDAVRRAQVGQAIFDLLAPSTLPGGTTESQIIQLRAAIQEAISGFRAVLNEAASSTLGDGAGSLFTAKVGAEGARLNLANALRDVTTRFNEALKQQKAIAEFDRKKAELEAKLKAGQITKKQFDEAIEKLGDRPVSLTHEQLNLLRSGGTSLDPKTVAGQANIAAIQQAVEAVRAWGQAALDAGTPLDTVIKKMKEYIAGIISEATQRGLNADAVRDIIDQLGLSNADLAEFREALLSLDISSLAGAANTQKINEQLQAIRDYASELLAAGKSPTEVAAAVRKLRDQLIAAAKAFGFNGAALDALVKAAGLTDASLADLIKQLKAFNDAAAGATDAAKKAAEEAKKAEEEANKPPPAEDPGSIPRPTVGVLNINLPYGDPEAVGLATVNRLAYEGLNF